ncbi:MAG: HAD family hydrolase [Lautropia sp.]
MAEHGRTATDGQGRPVDARTIRSLGIEALTFDTGGTILDWHTGFTAALAALGRAHGVERDWHALANDMRRRSLQRVVNLGEHAPPEINFDDAHRLALDETLAAHGLDAFDADERRTVWHDAVHALACWPDFPPALPALRERYVCVSFTLLSYRIVIDTGRRNGLSWDAVISCEGIGKYKILPDAYRTAAKYLQLDPSRCLMVACHNFDLDAAKAAGYRTAFVRRPAEWGPGGPPDPQPSPHHDLVVDGFDQLRHVLCTD